MRPFAQFVLASAVTLATTGTAHADLILSRAVDGAVVLVEKCDPAPAPTCTKAGELTFPQVRRIARTASWRGYARMLAFSITAPAYVPYVPNVFLYDYLTLTQVGVDLRKLVKTPGSMRIREVDAGFGDVYQLVTKALAATPST